MNFKEDCQDSILNDKNLNYKLPDGNQLNISNNDRFHCCEPLFNPLLLKDFKNFDNIKNIEENNGIHEIINKFININNSSAENKINLENIVLSGGSSLFPRFAKRLKQELQNLNPNYNFQIIDPIDRKFSAFIGGAMVSELSSFMQHWSSKEEYDESGPGLANPRHSCF